MPKKKLFEEILSHPARYYRVPADVLRDRRFSDEERAGILKAWAGSLAGSEEGRAAEIEAVLHEVESRLIHHAAQ